MTDLFIAAIEFYKAATQNKDCSIRRDKAAQIEKAPDTQPQYLDEQFQAYQFLGFLNTLAHIKNQLAKIKNNFPIFDSIFGSLVRIRPGTIKNAIQQMIETNSFDKAVYASLRDSIWKDIETNNLAQQLESLVQMIEVELLDKGKELEADARKAMHLISSNAKKAIRMIRAGLEYQ